MSACRGTSVFHYLLLFIRYSWIFLSEATSRQTIDGKHHTDSISLVPTHITEIFCPNTISSPFIPISSSISKFRTKRQTPTCYTILHFHSLSSAENSETPTWHQFGSTLLDFFFSLLHLLHQFGLFFYLSTAVLSGGFFGFYPDCRKEN